MDSVCRGTGFEVRLEPERRCANEPIRLVNSCFRSRQLVLVGRPYVLLSVGERLPLRRGWWFRPGQQEPATVKPGKGVWPDIAVERWDWISREVPANPAAQTVIPMPITVGYVVEG